MADAKVKAQGAPRHGRVDQATLDATTEDDIRRHMAEDGYDYDNPFDGLREVLSPAEIRARAGLTQVAMAEHLRIPVATWRNWEQERTTLDPAVRSLLDAVAADPEYTFKAIGGRALPDGCSGQLNRMVRETDAEFLLTLFTTTAFDSPPIPNEGARLRLIEDEGRFEAVLKLAKRVLAA